MQGCGDTIIIQPESSSDRPNDNSDRDTDRDPHRDERPPDPSPDPTPGPDPEPDPTPDPPPRPDPTPDPTPDPVPVPVPVPDPTPDPDPDGEEDVDHETDADAEIDPEPVRPDLEPETVDVWIYVDYINEYFVHETGTSNTWLLHLAGRTIEGARNHLVEGVFVDNFGESDVSVTLETRVVGFSETDRRSVYVPANDSAWVGGITPVLDLGRIYREVSGSTPTQIELVVRLGTEIIAVQTFPITLEPVNRVRWSDRAGSMYGYVVTLIAPDDDALDAIINQAIGYMPHGSNIGYLGTETNVQDEAQAIFRVLHERGFRYSNVAGSFFDFTQLVRTIRQSLANSVANCADGSLLYAAIFERMGLRTFLIFVPGHVFVGICLVEDCATGVLPIETTLTSSGDFSGAVDSAIWQWNECGEIPMWPDSNALGCTYVDVAWMRTQGIRSIPAFL